MATDTKSPGEKLSVSPTKTLTLKPRAETGVVRQSFSHGRSKAVVVEKVKRRIGPGEPCGQPRQITRIAALGGENRHDRADARPGKIRIAVGRIVGEVDFRLFQRRHELRF